jgi:hypothetical protein
MAEHCKYKKKCDLKGIISKDHKDMCNDRNPTLPRRPFPKGMQLEYCPAYRMYKSLEKDVIFEAGPITYTRGC